MEKSSSHVPVTTTHSQIAQQHPAPASNGKQLVLVWVMEVLLVELLELLVVLLSLRLAGAQLEVRNWIPTNCGKTIGKLGETHRKIGKLMGKPKENGGSMEFYRIYRK